VVVVYVSIELPKVLTVQGRDSIGLAVGNGMDSVIINGDGTIVVTANGGADPVSFSINIRKMLEELREGVKARQ
jgi:hypothetical protein